MITDDVLKTEHPAFQPRSLRDLLACAPATAYAPAGFAFAARVKGSRPESDPLPCVVLVSSAMPMLGALEHDPDHPTRFHVVLLQGEHAGVRVLYVSRQMLERIQTGVARLRAADAELVASPISFLQPRDTHTLTIEGAVIL